MAEKESDEYGFIAHLEDNDVVALTDCMGGGERFSYGGRDDLIETITEFIKSRAREYAEEMVEDLDIEDDPDDEDTDDEAPSGVKA
jgi:hypothetical protein